MERRKCCQIRHKLASKFLQTFEAIITKLLLIISICSIVYSKNWLPVLINFSFLFLSIFALVTYATCYKKKEPVLALPMLIHLSVCIFWIMIWLYASLASITTGYLWSLEWLGGPKSSRDTASNDIMDPTYVNPNETSPETKKSIKYGVMITVASLVVLVFKILCWTVAKKTFLELRKRKLNIADQLLEVRDSKESDPGAASPEYPVVMRVVPEPSRRSSPPPHYSEQKEKFLPHPESDFTPRRSPVQLSPGHMESSC